MPSNLVERVAAAGSSRSRPPNALVADSHLTPREQAVLRLVSMGHQASEIARALALGEETVRSHIKKAQTKLRARNRTHAACEAMRQNLIP
jgi:DNA-binding CsgD family transcriptional regulator